MVDRKSRFLKCEKLTRLGSKEVKMAMIKALRGQPVHSITPDRGREFQLHGNVTKELGVEFYFPPAHQPWQRGTNENTNGLLREYFLKVTTSRNSTIRIYKKSLTNSIKDLENVWVIERRRKYTFPLCCT